METLMNVVVVTVALYMVGEIGAAIYIFKKRATMVPRLQAAARRFLGLDVDFNYHANNSAALADETRILDAKVTIIGKWAKEERRELIKRGIIKVQPKVTNTETYTQ